MRARVFDSIAAAEQAREDKLLHASVFHISSLETESYLLNMHNIMSPAKGRTNCYMRSVLCFCCASTLISQLTHASDVVRLAFIPGAVAHNELRVLP